MTLQLRPATPADHPFLQRLDREAYEALTIRLFGPWDEEKQRARLQYKLRELRFRIIELDGQPIGAIASSDHEDHVFLNEMQILPAFQNRGFGAQVLREELERARALGKPVRLHTAWLNRAREFYRRHGFRETGRDEMFVKMESIAD